MGWRFMTNDTNDKDPIGIVCNEMIDEILGDFNTYDKTQNEEDLSNFHNSLIYYGFNRLQASLVSDVMGRLSNQHRKELIAEMEKRQKIIDTFLERLRR
jgi:hypothetical protein